MVLFQPDRHLLRQTLHAWGPRFHGMVLDICAGPVDRYSDLIRHSVYLRIDPELENQPHAVGVSERLPFPNACADGIVCTQVLGDLQEPHAALLEFARVLRAQGLLLVTESQSNEMHDEPRDYWRFTRFGIESLCRRAGFEVIDIAARGGWATCVAQLTFRYLIDRFSLYQRPWLGLPVNCVFRAIGRTAILWDRWDASPANHKHTIGWCVLARKP